MMRTAARIAAVALPAAFLAVFFVYPVATVVGRGLGDAGLDAFADLWRSPRQRGIWWFTVWQAVLSTVLTVAVALPGAAAMARMGRRGQRLMRAGVTVPFVLPTVVVAGAFLSVFSRLGLDGLRNSVTAIVIAHVFFNYAVVVRVVGSYWAGLDRSVAEQARVLGAGPWAVWREVTLPALRPAIAAAGSVVFLFTFTSYGVVLVLGGPANATIETEIYRFAVIRTDLTSAAALAVLQLVAVAAIVVVSGRLERRRPAPRTAARPTPSWSPLVVANVAVAALLLGGPLLVLVEGSLVVGDGWGLANYAALDDRVNQLPASSTDALINSLRFAVAATAIAVVVGGCASLVAVHGKGWSGHVADLGVTLPLGVSAVTVGFGMLLALDEPPLDLRTSPWIVPVAHALLGIPFVVRMLVPALRSIDPALREAAAVLGADPARVRREVDAPLGARALRVGAGFAFAVSLGEFGATSFLPRSPDQITAPVALFRLLGTPGATLQGQAMALAVVLMVVVGVAVFVLELGRADEAGAGAW